MKTWTYLVREKERLGSWGQFTLCSNGIFTCVTDFGNYGHRWPTQGFHQPDFRKEILRMERGYLLNKLCHEHKVYSPERTLQLVKECILYNRKCDGLSSDEEKNRKKREKAREAWDQLAMCDWLCDTHQFSLWYDIQNYINDPSELFCKDYSGCSQRMVDILIPLLKEAIRDELARERFIQEMCA